jgi:prepilin-type N-terminal cleavage/methylation domain-containing protein
MRDQRGFTLIEVLIAMVIMTTALVAIAELMAITLRMQMQGRNETEAVRLVQSKVDELVAVDFFPVENALVTVGGSLTADQAGYNDDPADSPGFHRRWQVESLGLPRVRKLTVKIIPERNDRRTTAEVQLTTFIRDP